MSNKYSNLTGHWLFIKPFSQLHLYLNSGLAAFDNHLSHLSCPATRDSNKGEENQHLIYQMPDPFLTSFLI